MNLNDFAKEAQSDLARFVSEWYEHHIEDPDAWPFEMEPGEWDEQYLMWLSAQ